MLRQSVVELASASRRVTEAKDQIEAGEATESALLQLGDIEAATVVGQRINELRRQLPHVERSLTLAKAAVHDDFNAMLRTRSDLNDADILQCQQRLGTRRDQRRRVSDRTA
ncbi:MAG: hypothetical protein HIU92_18495 [Proteobacteria bacterium]|nr:hypothetical protein [Pseudomonadota bacterium]